MLWIRHFLSKKQSLHIIAPYLSLVGGLKHFFYSRERLRRVLRKKAAVILHLHTLTPADLDLHTFTPADLDLHTLTPADLDLHTFTSADLDLHTLTSADLDLHTFTSADLDLHTFTPADLDLHTLTPADLDLHTLTSADLDLHTLTPADLDLHTFTSADLLSLFFYSLLRRGRCRRSATKRNPFARNGRWTSKTEENCDFEVSRATLTHEMGVGRQKLRKNCDFEASRATLSHEMDVGRQKLTQRLLVSTISLHANVGSRKLRRVCSTRRLHSREKVTCEK